MPAFNAEVSILLSIESVITQTYNNWELIIVDDGSTDNTKEVVSPLLEKDNRIRYFWQPNGRQGKARNLGLSKAKGSLIAFLDADDIWVSNKLYDQVNLLEAKDADLVFSNAFIFRNFPQEDGGQTVVEEIFEDLRGIPAVKLFLEYNRVPILTVLVKKAVIDRVGGFSEDARIQNAEDYHLWLRLLIEGYVFSGVAQNLAGYRIEPSSTSGNDRTSSLEAMAALRDIAEKYPHWREPIRKAYKTWIRKSLDSIRFRNRESYNQLIKTHFGYAGYTKWYYLVKALDCFDRGLSIRSAYFIMNYL